MTKVIVACDVSTMADCEALLSQFSEPIYVKIGMECYYALGKEIIQYVKGLGHRVFLDLKLHDIPNTVYHAMKQLAQLGVDMVNVHAGGGVEMMRAARRAVDEVGSDTILIAVTVLTSLDDAAISEALGTSVTAEQTAAHMAQQAKAAGLDGVVCSVYEAQAIHQQCGADFVCVTPGIAIATTAQNDQKRVATPELARELGSDYIVVGRAITQAANPYATYQLVKGAFQNEA